MADLLARGTGLLPALSILVVAGLLVSCARPEPGSPAAVAEQAEEKEEAKADRIEETVDELPDWFLKPPTAAHSVFATGTATSPDLQLAMDKAVLSAKRTLADRIGSTLNSKMKEFVTEVGQGEDAEVISEVERVTTNLIAEVNAAGYSQKEAKVLAQGSAYRAYVLLQYPVGKANRLLVDQVKKNRVLEARLRASKAFKELEEDIKKAKAN